MFDGEANLKIALIPDNESYVIYRSLDGTVRRNMHVHSMELDLSGEENTLDLGVHDMERCDEFVHDVEETHNACGDLDGETPEEPEDPDFGDDPDFWKKAR